MESPSSEPQAQLPPALGGQETAQPPVEQQGPLPAPDASGTSLPVSPKSGDAADARAADPPPPNSGEATAGDGGETAQPADNRIMADRAAGDEGETAKRTGSQVMANETAGDGGHTPKGADDQVMADEARGSGEATAEVEVEAASQADGQLMADSAQASVEATAEGGDGATKPADGQAMVAETREGDGATAGGAEERAKQADGQVGADKAGDAGDAAAGAGLHAAGHSGTQIVTDKVLDKVSSAGVDNATERLHEERRQLLQDKRSKQLHWGTSLQVYTPVQVWMSAYSLTPAMLGPGFVASKMVNSRGLIISTYKWTHANPTDVRGAIILYHSYTSHALWDFLRHQPRQQEEQTSSGQGQEHADSQGEGTCAAGAASGATGAHGTAPGQIDLRQWVPQYSGSWVEALYTEGFNVYAADHQSHGHSEGWRGWRCNVQDFFCFVEDSLQFLCEVVARDPCTPLAAPIYLLGYSMGGNIALQTLGALYDPLTAAAYHTAAAEAASLSSRRPPSPANAAAKERAAAASPGPPAAYVVSQDAAESASQCVGAASAIGVRDGALVHQHPPPLVSERVKGVVLLAPMLRILVDWKTKILSNINVHLLSCWLPNLRLVRSAGGSDYEYLDWWYEKDLFAYAGRSKSRMVANLFRAAERVKRVIKRLPAHLKILCLQGTRDMTVDYRGPLALTESRAKVDLMYLTGWSHYLAKEKGSELLIEVVVAWLRAKLQAEENVNTVGKAGAVGGNTCQPTGSRSSDFKQPPVLFDFPKYTQNQRSRGNEAVERDRRTLVDVATQTDAQPEGSTPAASESGAPQATLPGDAACKNDAAVPPPQEPEANANSAPDKQGGGGTDGTVSTRPTECAS